MNQVNQLTICRDNYDSQEDFENAVKRAVLFLINEEYIITVKYDSKAFGIVIISYDYANEEYGGLLPYWLTPEQAEHLTVEDEDDENEKV